MPPLPRQCFGELARLHYWRSDGSKYGIERWHKIQEEKSSLGLLKEIGFKLFMKTLIEGGRSQGLDVRDYEEMLRAKGWSLKTLKIAKWFSIDLLSSIPYSGKAQDGILFKCTACHWFAFACPYCDYIIIVEPKSDGHYPYGMQRKQCPNCEKTIVM